MMLEFNLSEEFKNENPEKAIELLRLENLMKKHLDSRRKEIGDRIKIWDNSGSCDVNGKIFWTKEEIFNDEFIVINNGLNETKSLNYMGLITKINLDLLVYSPKWKLVIKTNSNFCRLI